MTQVQDLIQIYREPEHFGTLESPDVSAENSSEICGGTFSLCANIENDTIREAKFSGSKCGSLVVLGSLLVDAIIDATVQETAEINRNQLSEKLGPYVDAKLGCTDLVYNTLRTMLQSLSDAGK